MSKSKLSLTVWVLVTIVVGIGGVVLGLSFSSGAARTSVTTVIDTTGTTVTSATTATSTVAVSASSSSSTSNTTASVKATVPVGAVLYLWYGYNYSLGQYTGGLGTSHWNDSSVGIVKDKPQSGGYYSSGEYVAQQLEMMREVGLNYVVVSWCGWGVTDFSNPSQINFGDSAINSATKEVFSIVSEMNKDNSSASPFKVVLLVDSFSNNLNYQEVYSFIKSNFYQPYKNEVLTWQGGQLLLWFNAQPPIQSATLHSLDSQYGLTSRVIGNDLSQAQWIWWSAPKSFFNAYSGTLCSCYVGNPVISSNGFVSVTPRYDDYYLFVAGGRPQYMRAGVIYSQGMYQSEWNSMLSNRSNVKLVLIYSWNEYHERSAIEPHFDFSNPSLPPDYLLNLTRLYVGELEAG